MVVVEEEEEGYNKMWMCAGWMDGWQVEARHPACSGKEERRTI